jgi:hypothetical protein
LRHYFCPVTAEGRKSLGLKEHGSGALDHQPAPRMIRGSPSATPMHFFEECTMIVVKEEPKKMSNIDMLIIALTAIIAIAILFIPYN